MCKDCEICQPRVIYSIECSSSWGLAFKAGDRRAVVAIMHKEMLALVSYWYWTSGHDLQFYRLSRSVGHFSMGGCWGFCNADLYTEAVAIVDYLTLVD